MKKTLKVAVLLTALFPGCEEPSAIPVTEAKIIGNWQVVTEGDYSPIVVEWGFYYVLSVKLYEDKTFKVNVLGADDPAAPKHGTWKLLNNGATIQLTSEYEDSGMIMSRTNEFSISVSDDELIFEDEWTRILHHRVD